jgi:hypothetical protein
MFRLLRVAILGECISQRKYMWQNMSLVNGEWNNSPFTNDDMFMACCSSPATQRSGLGLIKGQFKGDFWWIKGALEQVFLILLLCFPVSIIWPMPCTDSSFIDQRCYIISAVESITEWNTSVIILRLCGRMLNCAKCCDVTSGWSDCYDDFITFINCFSRAPRWNFCEAHSSVIQSVHEWLAPSFASRVIRRFVEELTLQKRGGISSICCGRFSSPSFHHTFEFPTSVYILFSHSFIHQSLHVFSLSLPPYTLMKELC